MVTWNITEIARWVKVMPESMERIDSGIHVKLRRELKQRTLRGASLGRWYDTLQHPMNVILFLLHEEC